MDAITKAYDGKVQMIDTSTVRVHQHAAGAKKRVEIVALVAVEGGLTTKIHAIVDAQDRPIRLMLTAGQVHDTR
jgi:transposase